MRMQPKTFAEEDLWGWDEELSLPGKRDPGAQAILEREWAALGAKRLERGDARQGISELSLDSCTLRPRSELRDPHSPLLTGSSRSRILSQDPRVSGSRASLYYAHPLPGQHLGPLRATGQLGLVSRSSRRNSIQPRSLAKNLSSQMQFLDIAHLCPMSCFCSGCSPGQEIPLFPNSAWLSTTHSENLSIYRFIYNLPPSRNYFRELSHYPAGPTQLNFCLLIETLVCHPPLP